VHALLATSVLIDIGRSLREAFFMLWETLWALILGFTLSGIVQAFVSKEQLQARLGSRRPSAIARATGYGMVSSSCSYAASAMSKSLFAKGADFVTAMVFMVASTNLVVELGLVLLVLLGWQFMAAEFVGGPIMIVLLALGGGLVLTAPVISRARSRLAARRIEEHPQVSAERQAELEATPLSTKLSEPAAWADASSYATADFTMLRKELLIGYLVAGFLAVLVPTSVWNALFLHGHGFWTTLENALVGPLIAVISWVCSIGNVPLAAALWSGGISFGGVIAFIFADLIAMPLILIYAKFYGWRLTLRLVGLFYVVMVLAGLATELLFSAAGLVPTNRSIVIEGAHFEWNYTTWLNLVFLVVAGGVWWLSRNRARFGGGQGYAIDPVCGMQVRTADAPARARFEGSSYYFCTDRCHDRFVADPARFAHGSPDGSAHAQRLEGPTGVDPICGMTVEAAHAAATRRYEGHDYLFCSTGCAARFDEDPTAALEARPPSSAQH
jgi:YHS domain-containing protein/uncharacterized membrane protein YraQ (UPF0718 family)